MHLGLKNHFVDFSGPVFTFHFSFLGITKMTSIGHESWDLNLQVRSFFNSVCVCVFLYSVKPFSDVLCLSSKSKKKNKEGKKRDKKERKKEKKKT